MHKKAQIQLRHICRIGGLFVYPFWEKRVHWADWAVFKWPPVGAHHGIANSNSGHLGIYSMDFGCIARLYNRAVLDKSKIQLTQGVMKGEIIARRDSQRVTSSEE